MEGRAIAKTFWGKAWCHHIESFSDYENRLCKHLAAVLYGIGARLDEKPELLFLLRGMDHTELLEGAPTGKAQSGLGTLDSGDLADVFGIEIAPAGPKVPTKKPAKKSPAKKAPKAIPKKKTKRKPAATKPAARKSPPHRLRRKLFRQPSRAPAAVTHRRKKRNPHETTRPG